MKSKNTNIDYLLNECQSSKGLHLNLKSKKDREIFQGWLTHRKRSLNEYSEYLKRLNYDIDRCSCVEVGKSAYDSIALDKKTSVICNDSKEFLDTKKANVYEGSLIVQNNLPFLSSKDGCSLLVKYDTFITQNPNEYINLFDFVNLHNSKESKIILGVYGFCDDYDMESKIYYLKSIKKYLENDYNENLLIYDDCFSFVIASKERVLK